MLVVMSAYRERRRSHVCPRSRIVKIFGVDIRSECRTSDREIARWQVGRSATHDETDATRLIKCGNPVLQSRARALQVVPYPSKCVRVVEGCREVKIWSRQYV